MRWLIALFLLSALVQPAHAESCGKSVDYILNDLPGELPQPAAAYRNLLQNCLQTLTIDNVKDAYVLRDGGIAVVPRRSDVLTTAQTLAAFCRKFPRGTARFITRREARRGLTPGLVVLMSSAGGDSCEKIQAGK